VRLSSESLPRILGSSIVIRFPDKTLRRPDDEHAARLVCTTGRTSSRGSADPSDARWTRALRSACRLGVGWIRHGGATQGGSRSPRMMDRRLMRRARRACGCAGGSPSTSRTAAADSRITTTARFVVRLEHRLAPAGAAMPRWPCGSVIVSETLPARKDREHPEQRRARGLPTQGTALRASKGTRARAHRCPHAGHGPNIDRHVGLERPVNIHQTKIFARLLVPHGVRHVLD